MTLFRLGACALAFLGTVALARGGDVPAAPATPAAPIDMDNAPAAPAATDIVRWGRIVQVLARVLDGSMTRNDFATIVDDHAWIAPFARNRAESARLLPERLGNSMQLVSARSAVFPAETAASEMIADLEKGGIVPASILQRLKPATPDEGATTKANATMTRWLAGVLDATPGTPVGVIALYDDGRRGPDANGTPQLYLVLVRGDFDVAGVPSVSRILYGTLDGALR